MWSYLDEENNSRAAEFITDWSRHSKYCGTPERVALPWSSRDRTSILLVTGTRIWKQTGGRSAAVAIRRSSQKRSSSHV